MTTMIKWREPKWLCGYGARQNHLVIGSTSMSPGGYRRHFACGGYSDFVPTDSENHQRPRCKKCQLLAAKQSMDSLEES
jgi:hypothetical protein